MISLSDMSASSGVFQMWELVLESDDGRRRWRGRAIAMIAAGANGTQKRIKT
jgi:hypothetical protein